MSHSSQVDVRYRSKTEVVYYILNTVRNEGDGAIKTKIMYGSFLTYKQLNDYLALMTDADLLYYNSETNTFKVTEKGLRFLNIQSNRHPNGEKSDLGEWREYSRSNGI